MDPQSCTVTELAEQCAEENARFRLLRQSDSRHCFELFRRAFQDSLSDALTQVYILYTPQVRRWVFGHAQFRFTGEPVDVFVSEAFANCYHNLRGQRFTGFPNVAAILAYLKMCVHSCIAMRLRNTRPELDIDEAHGAHTRTDVDSRLSARQLWRRIEQVLTTADDRLLARLAFVQELKPADISRAYPAKWPTARDVSVSLQRIRRALRRDPQLRNWPN